MCAFRVSRSLSSRLPNVTEADRYAVRSAKNRIPRTQAFDAPRWPPVKGKLQSDAAMISDKVAWKPLPLSASRIHGSLRVGLAVLTLSLVVLVILTGSGWKQVESVGTRVAADVIRLLEGRSPGERGDAVLVKTRQERVGGPLGPPPITEESQERVLGKVFPPDDESTFPADLVVTLVPEGPLDPIAELSQISPFLPVGGSPAGPIPGLPAIIGGGGGSGGGGGGGGDGGLVPPVIVTPPSAVPEPETWMLMLVGAFLCSAALRRRKRRQIDEPMSPCALGS